MKLFDKRIVALRIPGYETKAIEAFFSDMAEAGYLLHKLYGEWCVFRKTEPRKLKFSITYLSRVTVFDEDENETSMTYREYCEQAGWQFVCADYKTQVYCSDAARNLPEVETDERLWFQNVKKRFFREYVPFMILAPVLIWFLFWMAGTTTDFLNVQVFLCLLLLCFLCLYVVYEGIRYLYWEWKCRRAIDQGSPLPLSVNYRSMRLFCPSLAAMYLAPLCINFMPLLQEPDIAVPMLLYMVVVLVLGFCLRAAVKKRGTDPVTYMDFMALIVVVGLVIYFLSGAVLKPFLPEKEVIPFKNKEAASTISFSDFGYKPGENDVYFEGKEEWLGKQEWYFGNQENAHIQWHFSVSRWSWMNQLITRNFYKQQEISDTDLELVYEEGTTFVYREKKAPEEQVRTPGLKLYIETDHSFGRLYCENLPDTEEEILQLLVKDVLEREQEFFDKY